MTITSEDLQKLSAPFPLNWHTVREGYRLWQAEDADIRWFVYVDWWKVKARLDEVFGAEWHMPEPKIIPTSKGVIAIAGITIRDVTRWYNGAQDDAGADDAKGALTDALRRTAAQWGVAEYLYDTDLVIRTKTYRVKQADGKYKADYNTKDQREKEAHQQFEAWYKRQFGQQKAPQAPQSQPPAQNAAKAPQNAENGQAAGLPDWMNNEVGKCWSVLKAWLVSEGVYENEHALKNSFIKRGISDGKTIADAWKHKPARDLIAFVKARHDEPAGDVDFMGEAS